MWQKNANGHMIEKQENTFCALVYCKTHHTVKHICVLIPLYYTYILPLTFTFAHLADILIQINTLHSRHTFPGI